MHQSVINEMLQNIPDPQMREMYGSIVNAKYTSQVRCMSNKCKDRVIAYIDTNQDVHENNPLTDKKTGAYKSGLSSSRMRMDGYWGFHCYCGNYSILAQEERGIIGAGPPNKRDLETIADKLRRRKSNPLPDKSGATVVDGFKIEDIN